MSAAQVRFSEPPRRPRPRWGWLALALLALVPATAGLVAGWRALASPERFPVKAVRVDGRPQKVTEEQLRRAVEPWLGRGMLTLDLARMRGAVEALPWVERAGVRRRWPGVLVIEIRERTPLARWGEDALISEAGVVFAPHPASFPDGLPQLAGPPGSEQEVLTRFRRLAERLARIDLELVALALDERHAWRAETRQGAVIELGSAAGDEDIERFARAFGRVEAPEGARLARVDLRYPNGFALAWQERAEALQ